MICDFGFLNNPYEIVSLIVLEMQLREEILSIGLYGFVDELTEGINPKDAPMTLSRIPREGKILIAS